MLYFLSDAQSSLKVFSLIISTFVNAKILIFSYKISIFAFMPIVLEQSYFLDMIAPYVGIGHNFEF